MKSTLALSLLALLLVACTSEPVAETMPVEEPVAIEETSEMMGEEVEDTSDLFGEEAVEDPAM